MILNSKNTLIVAAHPDDEVLGCGGTIAKLVSGGCNVNILFLADGIGSRNGRSTAGISELEQRQLAAESSCKILGVNKPKFGQFPDNQMDMVSRLEIAQTIEHFVEEFQPDTIFTHHIGDLNVDHRRTLEGVVTACRPQPGHCVKTIVSFEVSSSTEWQAPGANRPFIPNLFVDISESLSRKKSALMAYDMEMRAYPHTRSIEAAIYLSKWRGASVGAHAAEAFVLQRAVL